MKWFYCVRENKKWSWLNCFFFFVGFKCNVCCTGINVFKWMMCVSAGDPQALLPEASGDHGPVWRVDLWHSAVQQRQESGTHHVTPRSGTQGNTLLCNRDSQPQQCQSVSQSVSQPRQVCLLISYNLKQTCLYPLGGNGKLFELHDTWIQNVHTSNEEAEAFWALYML